MGWVEEWKGDDEMQEYKERNDMENDHNIVCVIIDRQWDKIQDNPTLVMNKFSTQEPKTQLVVRNYPKVLNVSSQMSLR